MKKTRQEKSRDTVPLRPFYYDLPEVKKLPDFCPSFSFCISFRYKKIVCA
jgi:hypothetical protein